MSTTAGRIGSRRHRTAPAAYAAAATVSASSEPQRKCHEDGTHEGLNAHTRTAPAPTAAATRSTVDTAPAEATVPGRVGCREITRRA